MVQDTAILERNANECVRLQNNTQITGKVLFYFVYISQSSLVTFFCSPVCSILYKFVQFDF